MGDFIVTCSVTRTKCAGRICLDNSCPNNELGNISSKKSRGCSLSRSGSDAGDGRDKSLGCDRLNSVSRSSSWRLETSCADRKVELERLREQVRRRVTPRPKAMWNAIESWQAHLDQTGEGDLDNTLKHHRIFSKFLNTSYPGSDSDDEGVTVCKDESFIENINSKTRVCQCHMEGCLRSRDLYGNERPNSNENSCLAQSDDQEMKDSVKDIIQSVEELTRSVLNSADAEDCCRVSSPSPCDSVREPSRSELCTPVRTDSNQRDTAVVETNNQNVTMKCEGQRLPMETDQTDLSQRKPENNQGHERGNGHSSCSSFWHGDCSFVMSSNAMEDQKDLYGVVKPRLNSFGEDGMSSDFGSSLEFLDSSVSEIGYNAEMESGVGKIKVVSDDSDLGSSKDDLNSDTSSDVLSDDFLDTKCVSCVDSNNDCNTQDRSQLQFAQLSKDVGVKCRLCVDFSPDEWTCSTSSDAYSPPMVIGSTAPFSGESSLDLVTSHDLPMMHRDDSLPPRRELRPGDDGSIPAGRSDLLLDLDYDNLNFKPCRDNLSLTQCPGTSHTENVSPKIGKFLDSCAYSKTDVCQIPPKSWSNNLEERSPQTEVTVSPDCIVSCDESSVEDLTSPQNSKKYLVSLRPRVKNGRPCNGDENQRECLNELAIGKDGQSEKENDETRSITGHNRLTLGKSVSHEIKVNSLTESARWSTGQSLPCHESKIENGEENVGIPIMKDCGSGFLRKDSQKGNKSRVAATDDLDLPLISLEKKFPSFFARTSSIPECRQEPPSPSTSVRLSTVSCPITDTSSEHNTSASGKRYSTISKRYSSCLKTVTSALRRLPSPSRVLHRSTSLFGSHKCVYDLQLASLAYFSSCPSTPVTGKRKLTTTPSLLTFTTTCTSQSLPPSPCTHLPPSSFSSIHLPSPTQTHQCHSGTIHENQQRQTTADENGLDLKTDSSSLSSFSSSTLSITTTPTGLPPSSLLSSTSSSSTLTVTTKKTSSFWSSKTSSSSKFRNLRYRSLSLDSRMSSACSCSTRTLDLDQVDNAMPSMPSVPSPCCDCPDDVVCPHLPFLLDIYDAKKVERNRSSSSVDNTPKEEKKAQQFGLSLTEIKENTGHIIPKPVEDTIEYLKSVQGDEVQGLFRRCARVTTMREVQEKYDDGETVDFSEYGDPHLAGAILKKFLRELSEPLMTFDLFEPITRLHYLEAGKQVSEVQRILKDELPEDNYIILKFIYQFLQQVVTKSDINLMTSANMATVFGPNIAWPKGQANLANVEQAVKFSLILLDSFDDVFLR